MEYAKLELIHFYSRDSNAILWHGERSRMHGPHKYTHHESHSFPRVRWFRSAEIRGCTSFRAASVNPFDLALREGWLASMIPLQLPAIAGVDVAGIVMATGEGVTDFSIGQDVYGFMSRYSGAYAEYAAVANETIAPQPQTLDYVQAASVPLAATAAWQALFEVGGLKEGQKMLVHGGAGGVGTFAVQLAKLRGAHVLATTVGQNVEYVQRLGADEV